MSESHIHELIAQINVGLLSIDEARVLLRRLPWGMPETMDPLRVTSEGIRHLGHTDILTDEIKAESRRTFEGKLEDKTACLYCGGLHGFVPRLSMHLQPCPRIKRIVRNVDGFATEVEFWPPGQWERGIIFPNEVFDGTDDSQ